MFLDLFISCRSVSGIRGLIRECLIALTADIETRNYHQEFNSSHGIPPEHPPSAQRMTFNVSFQFHGM